MKFIITNYPTTYHRKHFFTCGFIVQQDGKFPKYLKITHLNEPSMPSSGVRTAIENHYVGGEDMSNNRVTFETSEPVMIDDNLYALIWGKVVAHIGYQEEIDSIIDAFERVLPDDFEYDYEVLRVNWPRA